MIAANYTADFYCDGCHKAGTTRLRKADYYDPNTFEAVGNTWGECVRYARAAGWRVSHDRRYCLCPLCIAAGIKLADVVAEDGREE
jgi:hypothetical protein